jgi:hypothetical protein
MDRRHNRKYQPGPVIGVSFRMPTDLRDKITEEAKSEQRSFAWTACLLIEEALAARREAEQECTSPDE